MSRIHLLRRPSYLSARRSVQAKERRLTISGSPEYFVGTVIVDAV